MYSGIGFGIASRKTGLMIDTNTSINSPKDSAKKRSFLKIEQVWPKPTLNDWNHWSGRRDLNLRLHAPKATRLDFKGLKPLKIRALVCVGCGYLLWF
jgi:hypothetical protein